MIFLMICRIQDKDVLYAARIVADKLELFL